MQKVANREAPGTQVDDAGYKTCGQARDEVEKVEAEDRWWCDGMMVVGKVSSSGWGILVVRVREHISGGVGGGI